jgi:hypothetical protein
MALNCTVTNARAKTTPVSAIIPEAAADRNACAEDIDNFNPYDVGYVCSSRGSTKPPTALTPA